MRYNGLNSQSPSAPRQGRIPDVFLNFHQPARGEDGTLQKSGQGSTSLRTAIMLTFRQPAVSACGRGRLRTQGTPARPGCYPLQDFWEAPACHLPFQASGRPNSPLLPVWGWGMLTGVDFLASPCVPSAVSGIRTPKLPLLPVWKKGQGDEGQKRAGMQNITHLSQEIYLEQGVTPGLNGRWGNRHAARCTESGIDKNDESRYNVKQLSLCIRSPGHAYITNQQHPSGRAQPVVARHVYWFRRLHVLTGNPFRGEPSPP